MNDFSIPPPVVLLGVPIHRVTLAQTIDWMESRIRSLRPGYMAIATVDFASQASRDVELQRLLLEADLVVCNGAPLAWASRWMDGNVAERIAPLGLMLAACERAAREGWKVFFLGDKQNTLARAKSQLLDCFPSLQIAGVEAAAPGADSEELANRIRAAAPDILFVSFGYPAQEKWIWAHHRKTGVPVCVGVGTAVEELGGEQAAAPAWVDRFGLAGLFGWFRESKRLALPFVFDLWFFSRAVARQKLALQQTKSGWAGASELAYTHSDVAEIAWSGRIDSNAIASLVVPSPSHDAPHILLDLSQVSFMDSTGLGFLTKLYKSCLAVEGTLVVVAASPAVQRLLTAVRLDKIIRQAPDAATAYHYMPGPTAALLPSTGGYQDEYLVWTLQGDIRAENAEEIYQQIRLPWDAKPLATELALDLSHVEFIDSHGVSILIKLYKMVRTREGGKMSIYGAAPAVRNVLALARLDKILGIAD